MVDVSRVWQNRLFSGSLGVGYARGVETEALARPLGWLMWGTDVRRMYRAMDVVTEMPNGSAILDVPCGGGVTVARLRPEQRVRYVAMDISAAMLSLARRRVRPEHRDMVECVQGSIDQMPFGDGEFDLCVCFNGLHCLPDPGAAIREIARCLKPGGRLVGDFVSRGRPRRAEVYAALLRGAGAFGASGTVDDARRWFTEAGLRIDTLHCSGALAHFVVGR